MLAEEAVEIGSGNAVECSRRLLSAIHGGNPQSVKRELARAARKAGHTLRATRSPHWSKSKRNYWAQSLNA